MTDSVLSKGMTFVVSFMSAVPNYLVTMMLLYFPADISPSAPPPGTA
jgi:hypothetical protein